MDPMGYRFKDSIDEGEYFQVISLVQGGPLL